MTTAAPNYTIIHSTPTVETYRYLRTAAGLSPKTIEAAERGLPNTLFGVQIVCDNTVIGMGRVIGDGGTFYQVVDIAVLPEYQGQGVGKKIMAEISDYIDHEVPESGYVSLLADGQAQQLYQQFGFSLTAPASVGMGLKRAAVKRPDSSSK